MSKNVSSISIETNTVLSNWDLDSMIYAKNNNGCTLVFTIAYLWTFTSLGAENIQEILNLSDDLILNWCKLSGKQLANFRTLQRTYAFEGCDTIKQPVPMEIDWTSTCGNDESKTTFGENNWAKQTTAKDMEFIKNKQFESNFRKCLDMEMDIYKKDISFAYDMMKMHESLWEPKKSTYFATKQKKIQSFAQDIIEALQKMQQRNLEEYKAFLKKNRQIEKLYSKYTGNGFHQPYWKGFQT